MKEIILITLSIILLVSCSPERRLHRLITKNPELLTVDTIRIQDTTIIPEVRIDTLVHHSALKDTVIITKEKLKLQLIEINDTIYIEAYQEPDTIIITKEIPVERIIHKEPENKFWKMWRGFKYKFLVYLFILLLIISFFIKKKR